MGTRTARDVASARADHQPRRPGRRAVRHRSAIVVVAVLAVTALLAGCSDDGSSAGTTGPSGTTTPSTRAVGADDPQQFTPVVASVPSDPVPFAGSDGKTHLVYELFLTSLSRAPLTLDSLTVVDAETGAEVLTLGPAEVADRFQLVDKVDSQGVMDAAQSGLLFVHVAVDPGSVPTSLGHRLGVRLDPTAPNPSGGRGGTLEETLRPVPVSTRPVPVLGPPLAGSGYLAADGCCDSTRHVRATLPVNGTLSIAQRYAIDWEQVDDQGRIYAGPKTDPKSYAIYGDEALAVADGTVVRVIDGLPEQTPGQFPEGISAEDADGNAVIIDLGGGTFVMYAHLQPGSPRVKVGDRVSRGQVVGLVGNSGNSLAPHLHIHLMDSPLSLDSSGLPYVIDRFAISGRTVSTAAFDTAEADGTPLQYTRVDPPTSHTDQYPMDQSLVTFG